MPKKFWPITLTLGGSPTMQILEAIMATLDEVKADLDNLVAAVATLITNTQTIIDNLKANANDPAKVQAIADELTAEIATVQAATPTP